MYNSYLLLKGVINFLSICWLLSRRTIIHVRVHSIRMELVARKRSYRLVFVSRRRVAAVWCCANVEITRIVERAARWRCLRVFVDRTVLRCLKIKKIFVDFNFFLPFQFWPSKLELQRFQQLASCFAASKPSSEAARSRIASSKESSPDHLANDSMANRNSSNNPDKLSSIRPVLILLGNFRPFLS